MTKHTVVLATALGILALCIPSSAAAGTPEVHCGEAACGAFTLNGSGSTIWSHTNTFFTTTCTAMTGTGNYTSKTGGTISLVFHGCIDQFGAAWCTSPGQPAGTVTLGSLQFDNIYLLDDKTKPGILITNVNSAYTCFQSPTKLTGNLIGELESGCNNEGGLLLSFARNQAGHQRYMQSTGTGPLFDLQTQFGASPFTTALDATRSLFFGLGKGADTTCV